MNKKNIAAVVLIIGIVLLGLGVNEYGTFGSRAGRILGASPSKTMLVYFIAGGLCTAYGLLQIRKKR
jgi:hypothetical protein